MRTLITVISITFFVSGCAGPMIDQETSKYHRASKSVELGMSKSRVLSILPRQDNIAEHRKATEKYIGNDGKPREVVYFRSGRIGDGKTTDDELTPYFFVDSKLVAVGWNALKAARNSTPVRSAPPRVAAKPKKEVASGTGFVVNKSGQVLTNQHVVNDCKTIRVYIGDENYSATLFASDARSDLAILNVSRSGVEQLKNSPFNSVGMNISPKSGARHVATFRGGSNLRTGDDVIAVGFPLRGLLADRINVTTGNVSALAGPKNDIRLLQITAPIQPGNSGGPLHDESGNVVGVVVSKLDALKFASVTGDIPQNINFAVNIRIAQIFLDAHGVKYSSANSLAAYSTADITEIARAYTLPIECRK